MTVEGSDVPVGSVPRPQPRPRAASRPNPLGVLLVAAVIALVGLGSLSAVGVYLSRDRTASSPAPQTVTVTKSPKAPSRAEGADGVFLTALGSYGIGDNGTEAVRQRFMEFGHQTCFSQLLPSPQPLDTTVESILAAENRDIAGNPWSPHFTHDDAQNLAQAAIIAYCPNAGR
jgi:Protein of unknown function (DUF732)